MHRIQVEDHPEERLLAGGQAFEPSVAVGPGVRIPAGRRGTDEVDEGVHRVVVLTSREVQRAEGGKPATVRSGRALRGQDLPQTARDAQHRRPQQRAALGIYRLLAQCFVRTIAFHRLRCCS